MKKKWFVVLGLVLTVALSLPMIGISAETQRPGTLTSPSLNPTRGQQGGLAQGITVLNVDADSGAPLAGWTMILHAGPGCTGSALQSGVTGADGLLSFPDLEAGAYSVREALQPGYLNDSPLCQDITLAPLAQGARLEGNSDVYPPSGDDAYAGGAYLVLQLGTLPVDAITLNGSLAIHRGDPGDANRNGLADVQMQVVSMTLSGSSDIYGPLSLRHKAMPEAAKHAPEMLVAPQALPWTPRADYLIVDNGVVAEGGFAASFGGHDDVTCVRDMRRWGPDGALGTWIDLAPLPAALDAPRGALVDGHIYVPGGWDCGGVPQAVLYVYDITTDTWSTGASPPTGRASYGIAAIEGKVYRIGGCSDAACTPSADVDIYDIASDTWSSGASYPIEIAWQACGAIEAEIYCAGGYDGVGPTHKAYRYTPLPVDGWNDPAITDLCRQWWAMGAGDNAIDAGGLRSVYVFGGVVDGFDTVTDLAVHYDKGTNSWYYFESLNFAVYRQGGGAANSPLGNQYSVGGLLPLNPPGVGFTLDAPAGGYHVQHYPTIPPAYSLCGGPPPVIPLDGVLEELQPAIPFPSNGRLNLLFDLDVGDLSQVPRVQTTLFNTSPLQVRGTVGAIPMDQQRFTFSGELPLYETSDQPVGQVQVLYLVTMPPGDMLVAFVNRQADGTKHFQYLPLISKAGDEGARRTEGRRRQRSEGTDLYSHEPGRNLGSRPGPDGRD